MTDIDDIWDDDEDREIVRGFELVRGFRARTAAERRGLIGTPARRTDEPMTDLMKLAEKAIFIALCSGTLRGHPIAAKRLRETSAALFDAIRAAQTEAQAVAIKPLAWELEPFGNDGDCRAESPLGPILIWECGACAPHDYIVKIVGLLDQRFSTMEEAKAFAQAEVERRVAPFLTIASAPQGGR